MPKQKLTLIIPCYNEGARLRVKDFERFIDSSPFAFIFVNDGSKDNTGDILNCLRKGREDRVVVLTCTPNHGKAEAVRYGINHAFKEIPEYVGFWDADLACPLDAIWGFLDVLDKRPTVGMVVGARVKLLGRRIERRETRHYIGRIFATTISTMLHLPVYDTQCGAKIFRNSPEIRTLFAEAFLSRWIFDVELIARFIQSLGSPEAVARRIYEYPLDRWEDVTGSKLKPKDFGVAVWDVMRIYRKYLRTPLGRKRAEEIV